MKNNHRVISDTLIFAAMAVVGLYLFRNAGFVDSGDDLVYKTSIETWGSWTDWARAYYHGNSGRVLIHGLLIMFLNLPVVVWKLVSAGAVGMTCWMVYRYARIRTNVKNHWQGALLALVPVAVFFFVMPGSVMVNAVRWASGSLNYLYPVCAMLICLYPFRKVLGGEHPGAIAKTAAALAVCLCGNMEQSSAVVSAMGILCLGYYCFGKEKTFRQEYRADIAFLALIWAVNTAVALIGYLSPGNAIRYTQELLGFVGYEMYTIPEKLILGVQLFVLYFYSFRGLWIWLLPSLVLVVAALCRREYGKLIPPVINIALSCAQNLLIRGVFNLEFLHPADPLYLLWLGGSVALLFFNGSLILRSTRNRDERFWLLFLYYGLIAAGVVVSLSPTLYMSSSRTIYISYIMLMLVITRMVRNEILPDEENPDHGQLWSRFNGIFCAVVSVAVVCLFVLGTYTVRQVDVSTVSFSTELQVKDVVIDREKGTLEADVSIAPFGFTAWNWCLGEEYGYDFDVNVGVLDTQTGTIRVYRTYLHPQYPVMEEYTDAFLPLTGYLRDDCLLTEGQQFVMVYSDHEGNQWYTPLAQE